MLVDNPFVIFGCVQVGAKLADVTKWIILFKVVVLELLEAVLRCRLNIHDNPINDTVHVTFDAMHIDLILCTLNLVPCCFS